MTPKQYLAVQLQMVNIARQVVAIDLLDEFLATATRAKEHEDDHVLSPEFIEARDGLALIRDLAGIFVGVKQKCIELDAFFHKTAKSKRGAT